MKAVYILVAILTLFSLDFASAEPWMANRSAQNCAGCHAPGRLNRKPSKRRCTLSCQGCHVNPNGGGLRNAYGKWNSERWARSFYTDLAWNKKSPAPLKKQKYMHKKLSKKKKLRNAKKGAKLVGFKGVVKNHAPYMESSSYKSAKNEVDELNRMTRDDPYRIERRNMVTAGGDLRFFYIQQSEGAASPKLEEGSFFPMVFDFGVRVRPIKENLSFVYEGRAINAGVTEPSSLDKLFGSSGKALTRSAYVLVDDLWYNSYAQYGYYRPAFGIMTANHNAMTASYTNIGYSTSLKSAGFGAAPNVPFGIVNVIMATEGASDISSEDGFNATLGLRFVRMGAHLTATYWSTSSDSGLTPFKRDMWNVNAGVVFIGRFILNGEITSVRKEANGIDETKIISADLRIRMWRETYFRAGLTQANAAVATNNLGSGTGISPGSGSEMVLGFRAFTVSGLEFETLSATKVNKEDGSPDATENTLSVQMHAYF